MALISGNLLHLLATVSTIIFGGVTPQQHITPITMSKSMSGEIRSQQQKQATGTLALAKQLKFGKGGGEPRGVSFSPQETEQSSRKKRDESASRTSRGMRGAKRGFQDIPSQISSQPLLQEAKSSRTPIPVDLQIDQSQNQVSAKKNFAPYTDSSSVQQDIVEKASFFKEASSGKTSSEERPHTDSSSRTKRMGDSTADKVTFINIGVPTSDVSAPLQLLVPTQDQPSKPQQLEQQQQIVEQHTDGSPHQTIKEEEQKSASSSNLKNDTSEQMRETPLPPPVDLSDLPRLDSTLLEQARQTPPPVLPDDIVLPPSIGDIPFDQDQFDQAEQIQPPPPEPIVQPQSDQQNLTSSAIDENNLEQQESPFQKALKEKKLKPISTRVDPQQEPSTEVLGGKNKLQPAPEVIKKQSPANALLMEIQKGKQLKQTAKPEMPKKEVAIEENAKPVFDKAMEEARKKAIVKERAKAENEKEMADKATIASKNYSKSMEEIEVKKVTDSTRGDFLESIKQGHTLKPVSQHAASTKKTPPKSVLEETLEKRRKAFIDDDETPSDQNKSTPKSSHIAPETSKDNLQDQSKTTAKSPPVIFVNPESIGDSIEKAIKAREKIIQEKKKNLPVSGSSSQDEDDEWK